MQNFALVFFFVPVPHAPPRKAGDNITYKAKNPNAH